MIPNRCRILNFFHMLPIRINSLSVLIGFLVMLQGERNTLLWLSLTSWCTCQAWQSKGLSITMLLLIFYNLNSFVLILVFFLKNEFQSEIMHAKMQIPNWHKTRLFMVHLGNRIWGACICSWEMQNQFLDTVQRQQV